MKMSKVVKNFTKHTRNLVPSRKKSLDAWIIWKNRRMYDMHISLLRKGKVVAKWRRRVRGRNKDRKIRSNLFLKIVLKNLLP